MKLDDVNTNYGKAAKQYDYLLNFWFGKILRIEKQRETAVDWLSLAEGNTVLDIGCGTGANFAFIENKIGEHGKIIGIDYTLAMLHHAQKKIELNNWNNITLIHGDATKVNEFVNTKVNAIISTYCFSILYDVEKAFSNALSVLKQKGNFVLLDIKRIKPENKLARMVYPLYSSIAKRYGIISSDDLIEDISLKRLELLHSTFKINLINIEQKEFLLNTFFILKGQNPN